MLKETVFAATQTIRANLGPADWCVSVFRDNSGVVRFDGDHDICVKVETHNHPSAIEPYGGAATGLGGVIRDVLGTGRAAKPIANLDVFCVGPSDLPADDLPPGVIHPRRLLEGVVTGVRDYGNRMGIPTIAGGVFYDPGYLSNPLVSCGTVGVMPRNAADAAVQRGDLVVVAGGRIGLGLAPVAVEHVLPRVDALLRLRHGPRVHRIGSHGSDVCTSAANPRGLTRHVESA